LALLQMAGDGVEITAALEARKLRPAGKGFFCGGDGGVDFGLPGRRDAGERFAVGRILYLDAGGVRAGESAIDEMAEDAAMALEPRQNVRRGLRSRSVFHGFHDVPDVHLPDLSSVRG